VFLLLFVIALFKSRVAELRKAGEISQFKRMISWNSCRLRAGKLSSLNLGK
jgi:hypothetical protein